MKLFLISTYLLLVSLNKIYKEILISEVRDIDYLKYGWDLFSCSWNIYTSVV